MRHVLIVAGWFFLCAGVAGIFLPLLPTVPFLLLAGACFARSSPRCHAWLVNHPRLGPLIAGYLDGRGIPRSAKITAILMIWTSGAVSLHFVSPPAPVRIVLAIVAAGVTVYLLRLPTRPR